MFYRVTRRTPVQMALVLHQMLKVALGLLAAGLLITLVGSNTDYWFVGSGVHYGLWNICSALTCVDLASVVSPVPGMSGRSFSLSISYPLSLYACVHINLRQVIYIYIYK